MAIFTGAATAIVTPFKANGEVDYDTFAKNIEFQIENKIDAIVVCGTTGEASTLTHEEHLDVIRYCVKCVNKRVPVVAGTGSNCTETAIYLSQEAEKAGVDGLLIVTPYYNKATQKGLYEHFKLIAEAVEADNIIIAIKKSYTDAVEKIQSYLALTRNVSDKLKKLIKILKLLFYMKMTNQVMKL